MADENDRTPQAEQDPVVEGDAPSTDEVAVDDGTAEDGAVIDDPDEPVNPDESTRAETEAARAALTSTAPRRKYRGPQSILIMLFVVATVIATGIYAVVWYERIKEADDRGDLRRLEEREVMAKFQRRSKVLKFGPDSDVVPAGLVYEPLTPLERGTMRRLQQRFGAGQFKPDDKQNMFVREVRELEEARGLKPTSVEDALAPPAVPAASAPATLP